MKGAISIILLSIYLFGTTEAYQALKLPMLVEHYIQHMHENRGITLLGFLRLHYLDKTVVDKDYQQDMQLPFKTHENAMSFPAPNDIPQSIGLEISRPLPAPIDHCTRNTRMNFSYLPHSIFQPPRA